MAVEVWQWLGYAAIALSVIGAISVAAANVLYSRPRIDAQAKRIRDLEDDASTARGIMKEKDSRVEFLQGMAMSRPAFDGLTEAIAKLQGDLVAAIQTNNAVLVEELEAHDNRSQVRDEKIVTALHAITARLERHSDHRAADVPHA